ncbi:MAG TPA: hypothetical protein PLR74_17320 [Agriterribacter sp.]|nr:hypothetical protein [Agriterribacter sp.]
MQEKTIYNIRHHASAVIMIFTLLWLTVSAPFILDIRQQLSSVSSGVLNQTADENTSPFSGLSEEKCSSNTFSEYLHEPLTISEFYSPGLEHGNHAGSIIYIAYYGELISPPPEA